MSASASMRKPLSANRLSHTPSTRIPLAFAAIACVSTIAFEPIHINAQEWTAQNVSQKSVVAPIAQISSPTHLVIQPPHAIVHQDEVMFVDQFTGAELPAQSRPKKNLDLTHAIPSHAGKTPRSTAIPQASRTTGWKQPYSYGHFGAKHNRQWSVHHGHQHSHTQWTFR